MKMKLAVLDRDGIYLKRLSAEFGARYGDLFEMYAFTEPDAALAALDGYGIDVFLAGTGFDIDAGSIPRHCGFAYLAESPELHTVKGRTAVCKFQMASQLCAQIRQIHTEHPGDRGAEEEAARTILFTGVSGGVGTSTMAAACARHFGAQGKRVLYLNLEQFGSPELYFRGEGQFTMRDVIAAVKSRKPNLEGMLSRYVRCDAAGVHFFAQSPSAADMLALDSGVVHRLLETLQWSCGYDYIIADGDFALDQASLEVMRRMHAIVLVGSGSAASNRKTERAYEALTALERGADRPLNKRVSILYNKLTKWESSAVACRNLRRLAGAPRYSGLSTEQLLSQLQQADVFDKIL